MISIASCHLILIHVFILICAGNGERVTCNYIYNSFGIRIGINIF